MGYHSHQLTGTENGIVLIEKENLGSEEQGVRSVFIHQRRYEVDRASGRVMKASKIMFALRMLKASFSLSKYPGNCCKLRFSVI